MKDSGLKVEIGQQIGISNRSRFRLIQQNKKLIGEVFKLEQIINTVIQKTATDEFKNSQMSEQIRQKFRNETDEQLRMIARMKKEIKAIKASLAEHKYDQIKNEENQVVFLRREMEKLSSEKETLTRKKMEKEQALEYHKPINSQTANTLQQYKKTKAKNNELKYKIHQLERQVGKYHKLKELAKSSVPKEYDNPEYQYIKIDKEISQMRKQMKRIEEKWRSKVEAIDKEYFSFKEIRKFKEGEIENLEKEIKGYQNRMGPMRDQTSIHNDRERISSVVISTQKRKEMQQLMDQEKKKLKRLEPKGHTTSKIPKTKEKNQLQKHKEDPKPIPESKDETKSQKQRQQPLLKPQATHYSQIIAQKQQKPEQLPSKPTKILQSVGVGTSFYYADD